MRKKITLFLLVAASLFSYEVSHAEIDASLLAATQSSKPAFMQDLSTLVNIDSGTGDEIGLAKAEIFLVQQLKKLGAKVETFSALPAVGKMVIGTFQGNGSKNILLMIHYDTVFGTGEALKRPFKIMGNKAFGPGVADAKGGALIILHALDIAFNQGFKEYKTLTVFFNPDEEKSSLGSRETIQKLSSEQDVVLSFEPPKGDQVAIATNGIANVHLDVTGLASHAGAPEKGHNAVVELANQIMQLNDLGDPLKGTMVSWTVVKGSDRVNIIPEKASATADMRLSDLTEIERVQNDANKIIEKKIIPETKVVVSVEYRRSPLTKNSASDNLAILTNDIYQELGKTIEPVAIHGGTDAGFAYNPNSSKPAVLEGMGIIGGHIHTSEEWADLDSIPARLYLTVRMLQTVAKLD